MGDNPVKPGTPAPESGISRPMKGGTLPDEFWHIEAEISVIPALTFEDIAPVAMDLNERLLRVRGSRTNFGPSLAAGPDLAVNIILTAVGAVVAAEALRKFVGLLAEDIYKAIRAGLLRLIGKANERDNSRTWNLGITIESHLFIFPSPMDDEEFVSRLLAMRDVLGKSPDGLVDGTREIRPEPGGGGWWWDLDRGLWVPTPGLEEAHKRAREQEAEGDEPERA